MTQTTTGLPKIALAHDWLSAKAGGAEQVLEVLAQLFPDAPIYTLLYDRDRFGETFDERRVITSPLQRKSSWLRNRPRYLLPFIPAAVEALDFRGFDLVLSSSGAWMKNILTPTHTRHLCYCHSPMRFVWDYWPEYLTEQRVGSLRAGAIRTLTSYLRLWDQAGASRVDRYLANSETTRARIQKFYNTESKVVFPPVNLSDLRPQKQKGDFLLCVGSLTPYKKFDLAIQAANQLGRRLVIVGDGADRSRLESLAGETVEFAGYASRKRLVELYATAQALVHPQLEDFGITAVEALASGTPVVAYRAGGATETLTEETGVFFDDQTPEALQAAIEQLGEKKFDAGELTASAARFDRSAFEASIKEEVQALS
jgi:glycosyltransferase involved in cell wall biosynthesis